MITINREKLTAISAEKARARRDALLRENVDTMNPMRWASLSTAKKGEWNAYRQALLDVTRQLGFPFEVQWPELPGD